MFNMAMMNLVQVADNCRGLGPIVKLLKEGLLPIVYIGIPIILIVLGIIDLGRAVIASDEKEIKAAQSRLIKRCIYAALIFFIVVIVQVLMNVVATGAGTIADTSSWASCWKNPV